jgi:hypothetical protein
MKNIKKYFIFIGIFLALAAFLLFFFNGKGVVGNQDAMNELTKIEKLSVPDENGNSKITLEDLNGLENIVKGDHAAEEHFEELRWLVSHNQSEHIIHSTSFMREYIETGKETPCLPHELWHLSLFIKYGDVEYAEEHFHHLDDEYDEWVKSVEAKRELYPQYYKSLDELEKMSRESIENLKKKDYSSKTLEQMDLIGQVGLC